MKSAATVPNDVAANMPTKSIMARTTFFIVYVMLGSSCACRPICLSIGAVFET